MHVGVHTCGMTTATEIEIARYLGHVLIEWTWNTPYTLFLFLEYANMACNLWVCLLDTWYVLPGVCRMPVLVIGKVAFLVWGARAGTIGTLL
jgi:hypothetical protein